MGLNLGSLGKKITDVLGGAEHAIGGAGQAIGNELGHLPGQIVHQAAPLTQIPSAVTNYGVQSVAGLGNALLVRPFAGTYDAAKAGIGALTGNQQAESNAVTGLRNDFSPVAGLAQGALRTVPQVLETVRHPLSPASYTPNSTLTRGLFGGAPVQNIQAGVTTNFNQHAGTPIIPRLALAGAYGVGQVAQDVPVVGSAAKVALKGADVAGKGAQLSLDAAKTANTAIGEKGAIGGSDVPLTPLDKKIGRSMDMTDKEIADVKARGTSGIAAQNAARQAAEETTAAKPVTHGDPVMIQNPINFRTPEENIAANPVKKNVPTVAQGDFAQARINPKLASAPVAHATANAVRSIKALSRADKENFIDSVENPSLIKSAKDPEKMQAAVDAHNYMTNLVHATNQALGGNTDYRANFFHHDVNTEGFVDEHGQPIVKGERSFNGLNATHRKYNTVKDLEAAGHSLVTRDPVQATLDYGNRAGQTLHKQALIKAVTEADAGATDKSGGVINFHDNNPLQLSKNATAQLKGFIKPEASNNKALKGYRAANAKTKHVLLTASQYHPVNVNVLQAAPSLLMSGHPLRAAKGIADTVATAVPLVGKKYSAHLAAQDIKDGVVEAAARMGTPIGQSDFGGMGSSGTVFGRQIPAMHSQMVRAAMSDLAKEKLSLDSPESHALGQTIEHIMGFVNTEAQNLDPRVQRVLGDFLLAPQFERSKINLLGDALKPGLAGKYARSAVFGKYATEVGVSLGLGAATGQKSNNLTDTLIQTALNPAASTGLTDARGNSVKFKLPNTGESEIANALLNESRGQNGRLKVGLNDPLTAGGNIAQDARNKLAVLPGDVLKIATNSTYASKPLYDPAANTKTKAEQAATTLGADSLPIGLQGLAYTKAVENALPKGVSDVLKANSPGTNPIFKSALSAVGITPETDTTTGKALQSTQYYTALDQAKKGLNAQEQAAVTLFTGSKKNPVTGQYDVAPSVEDTPAKANALLQNPKALDHLITMNKSLGSQGNTIDPLWNSSPQQIKAYLQYQTINKNNTAQLTDWQQKNKSWYPALEQQRSTFFNSLPPGDPNKPKNPIQPPASSDQVQAAFQQYDAITDPTRRALFFGQHPELSDYMDQMTAYTNKVLTAQGLTPLKPYPKADPNTASYVSTYMKGDATQRASLRTGNPEGYQKMQAYLENVSEYEVAKNGALDQLQGQNPNQSLLKGINSLGSYDMMTNPDGTLALKYGGGNPSATTYSGGSAPVLGAASTSSSSSASKSATQRKFRNIGKTLGKKAFKPYVKTHRISLTSSIARPIKPKVAFYPTGVKKSKRAKVSIKRKLA